MICFDLQVMENPQTVLLCKVVQSNDALGKAHINKLEGTKIADRWRDLQQSINILFDSKTAPSESSLLLVFEYHDI